MLTFPPWSRLACVRALLRDLAGRVSERVVRLLSDGLGEAVRGAAVTLLLARPRPQPRPFHPDHDPFAEPEIDRELEFDDEFEFDDERLAAPLRATPIPVEQPKPPCVPLWKRTLLAGLRGVRWCLIELPMRRPVLTTVAVAAVLTVAGCVLGPVAGILGAGLSLLTLILPGAGCTFN